MKRLWLAAVAIIALSGGSALAADMPVKAAPIVCPACNWSGFYIGGNVGGSIGHDATSDFVSLLPPGGGSAGVINPISATAYPQSLSGAIGGGQAGFNWQVGKFVLGAEADWDWSGQRDNLLVQNWISSTIIVAPNRYVLTDERKLNWLATARARLGWANGYSLWYVTGGAAWGGLQSNYTFASGNSPVFASAPAAANFGTSTKSGWTVGGGVETSLAFLGANNWSAKMEYLYVDLGNRTDSFIVPVTAGTAAYTISSSTAIRDHIVRLGLNYRFGSDRFAPQPPTPGPCPTCNWQGFYVGVNAGGIVGQDRSRDIDSFIPPGGNACDQPLDRRCAYPIGGRRARGRSGGLQLADRKVRGRRRRRSRLVQQARHVQQYQLLRFDRLRGRHPEPDSHRTEDGLAGDIARADRLDRKLLPLVRHRRRGVGQD